jgi:hypothetical protein
MPALRTLDRAILSIFVVGMGPYGPRRRAQTSRRWPDASTYGIPAFPATASVLFRVRFAAPVTAFDSILSRSGLPP